ncbi:hypothetical protein TSOC_011123 [Tetrabaena socialis]|uniref:Ricin B lectin domain-containing protein n=1 Tax=Tetrabaena socialis TaxID=47790 RepID=A0A2J7ZRG0_9CHLO|nr:hypothetical protein TSOC_011123 [Tetrabaena socialis]|eukprot:PNH02865.1 hypothetical protein TSOC_011123 [Tetrabaena socialis]
MYAPSMLQLWDCYSTINQQFTISPVGDAFSIRDVGDGYYQIKNVNSGKCIDLTDYNPNNGAVIQQWSCFFNNAAKRWMMEAFGTLWLVQVA